MLYYPSYLLLKSCTFFHLRGVYYTGFGVCI